MRASGPAGGGGEPATPVSERSLERYAELLGLDEVQVEVARTLHEGYRATLRERAAEFQEEMGAILESLRNQQQDERGQADAFKLMRRMEELRVSRAEASRQAEAGLMNDLQQILTPAQQERWPAVERDRRREVALPRGTLSAESVNVLRLVDELELSPDTRDALEPTLSRYEKDLDRALVARERAGDWERPERGAMLQMDPDTIAAMQEASEKVRKASESIQEINRRYARLVAASLPEELRGDFESAFHRASFPRVYRRSHTLESLDTALAFSDLRPEQRTTLESLRDRYLESLELANQRWAQAIRDDEKDGRGPFSPGGGMRFEARGPGDAPPRATEARRERRSIDREAREALLAALDELQASRLPPDPVEQLRNSGGVFVMSDVETDGEGNVAVRSFRIGEGEGDASVDPEDLRELIEDEDGSAVLEWEIEEDSEGEDDDGGGN